MELALPCGQCLSCRLARAEAWKVRICHEASLHDKNVFVTLTYNDEYLPADFSVDVVTVQKFLKRLRKRFGEGVRFYCAAEYGETNFRPHYHLILFGVDFDDKTLWRKSPVGYPIFRSEVLEKVWSDFDPVSQDFKPFGHCEIGVVTPESAGYVARYCVKKITGVLAAQHYQRLHPVTGEIVVVRPEFHTMSRNPGIGFDWFDKYAGDCFPDDFCILNGKRHRVPPAYLNRLSEDEQRPIKANRAQWNRESLRSGERTPARLRVKAEVVEAKAGLLKRPL